MTKNWLGRLYCVCIKLGTRRRKSIFYEKVDGSITVKKKGTKRPFQHILVKKAWWKIIWQLE